MASDPTATVGGAPGLGAPQPTAPWRRALRTGVVTLLAAMITPFIVPIPHARAAVLRGRDAVVRARRRAQA